MGEDREHEPTDWTKLPWATMTDDEVKATMAAMEREHWARAPAHEARRAKEEAAAEARLIARAASTYSTARKAYGGVTMEERNRRTREADARL